MNDSIGFYGIISDPRVGWVPMAEIMVAAGVRWIQLRMKQADPADRIAVAREVRSRIPAGHRFIVNDHPELARAVGADGVHLGQGDMPLARARAILGPGFLLGLSTHSVSQVHEASALGPAYIGLGPVFDTGTKLDAEPTIGLGGLAAMASVASVPTVAIGGITLDRVAAVCAAGVGGLCAVGPVNRSEDPRTVILAFQRRLGACLTSRPETTAAP
jgi:thiamine-phosphate pyrophosphorylase